MDTTTYTTEQIKEIGNLPAPELTLRRATDIQWHVTPWMGGWLATSEQCHGVEGWGFTREQAIEDGLSTWGMVQEANQ